MSNMHYCRFQNTLSDLRECYDSMVENEAVSEEESKARDELIGLCKVISEEMLGHTFPKEDDEEEDYEGD